MTDNLCLLGTLVTPDVLIWLNYSLRILKNIVLAHYVVCVKDVVLSTEAVPWTGLPLSLRSLRAFTTQSSAHRQMPRFSAARVSVLHVLKPRSTPLHRCTPLHRVLAVLLAAPPLAPRHSVACMASSYSHCSLRRSRSCSPRRSRSCSPQHSPAMQIASDSLLESVTDSIASQEVPDSASRKKEKKSARTSYSQKKKASVTKI